MLIFLNAESEDRIPATAEGDDVSIACCRWMLVFSGLIVCLTRLFRLFTGLVLFFKLLETWFYVVWWLLYSPITFNQVPTYLVVGLTRRKVRSSNFHRFFSKDCFFRLLSYRELQWSAGCWDCSVECPKNQTWSFRSQMVNKQGRI